MEPQSKTGKSIIAEKYLGTWTNTWKESNELRQFRLFMDGDELWMEIEDALGSDKTIKKSKVKAFTASSSSDKAIAFEVKFDLAGMMAFMSINYNKGILIIACFHNFKEASSGSDYFTRQFYSRVGKKEGL